MENIQNPLNAKNSHDDFCKQLDDAYQSKLNAFINTELSDMPPVACDFSVGDVVVFTNEFGVSFQNLVIIGFSEPDEYNRFIHIHTKGSAYWFPHKPEELAKQS